MALSKVLHSSRFIWAAEDDICSLSVGRRDQLEWVARYYTKLPDELAKGVEKKLNQKTRTSTAKTFGSSHAAFLNSLKWIWTKHQLLHGGEMPEHVARALSNSSCHSKSGDTDLDACAEAMRCLELGLRQRSLEIAEEGHAKKGAHWIGTVGQWWDPAPPSPTYVEGHFKPCSWQRPRSWQKKGQQEQSNCLRTEEARRSCCRPS